VEFQEPEAEEEGPPEYVVKGFDLLAGHNYEEAIGYASNLISTYPEDDRIHDTLATAYLIIRQHDKAITICRSRWEVAKEEKTFFIGHGRHKRLPEGDDGEAPHFYAPETWLEKYWIALKAEEYSGLLPEPPDPDISSLIAELYTANDLERFPAQQEQGLEQRKEALAPTIDQLKQVGPDAIPYLGCHSLSSPGYEPVFLGCATRSRYTRALLHRDSHSQPHGYHHVQLPLRLRGMPQAP
jgi:hypothetical protein